VKKERSREILKKLHESLKYATVDSAKIKTELGDLQSRTGYMLLVLSLLVLGVTIAFNTQFGSEIATYGNEILLYSEEVSHFFFFFFFFFFLLLLVLFFSYGSGSQKMQIDYARLPGYVVVLSYLFLMITQFFSMLIYRASKRDQIGSLSSVSVSYVYLCRYSVVRCLQMENWRRRIQSHQVNENNLLLFP
jgi:hypothetical protein